MSLAAGTVVFTSGATTTTSPAITLAKTATGALNVVACSVNSTGSSVQPVIATPSGWVKVTGSGVQNGTTPMVETAVFYRFRQAGDPTTITVTWTATGNGAFAPIGFDAGDIDTTTPIVTGEQAFATSSGPTTDVTGALTLGGNRYVVSMFANRSGATWSAAVDGNIHDAILCQGASSGAASIALCGTGAATSTGNARSLTSSASTSIHIVGIMAFQPSTTATVYGFYYRSGGVWKAATQ